MNIIFTKEKRPNVKTIVHKTSTLESLEFSKSPSTQSGLRTSGDGDCVRCCRLCGGDACLKSFSDSYVWEGVEERYDQLLFNCFGVKVTSPDCMICDWCIRALRGTERFKALVHAAFDASASATDVASDNDGSSTVITIKTNSCKKLDLKELPKPKKKEQPQFKKKAEILPKRHETKQPWIPKEKVHNRINVQCQICKQRYPMMTNNGECTSYICSRCKKNRERGNICKKCNIVMPGNMLKAHTELHVKAETRGRNRLRQVKNKLPLPRMNVNMLHKLKFQCPKCSKKYSLANDLAVHMRDAHNDTHKLSGSYACDHAKPYFEEPRRLD